MKTSNFLLPFLTLFLTLFTACDSEAQNPKPGQETASTTNIELIQFHSEHRCMTCNKIESFAKETKKLYPAMSFELINVDDPKNEKMAEKFEAAGTALFLYNSKTGKKKDLTDFAFMNAGNKDKFIAGLKAEIESFIK